MHLQFQTSRNLNNIFNLFQKRFIFSSDDNSNILNRIKELVSNLSDDSDEEIVKKELSINLIDCVKYNKTYESDDEQRIRKKMNEIDRLCNLNTVLRPSKKKTNKKNVKKGKKKRFRKQILSDSTSSYYTSSDSETEFPKMDLNCDLIDEKILMLKKHLLLIY